MYTTPTKKSVLLILGIVITLLITSSAFAISDTKSCKKKEGVDFFQEETGWMKLNLDAEADLYIQEFVASETYTLSKVDFKLRNYQNVDKTVALKVRDSIDDFKKTELAAGTTTVTNTMKGEWFTFNMMPEVQVEAGKTYYLILEHSGTLSDVKVASSTIDLYSKGAMEHYDYVSDYEYALQDYEVEYDLLFRVFNCDGVVTAAPVAVVEETPQVEETEEIITANAAKDTETNTEDNDVQEIKKFDIAEVASTVFGSLAGKIILGVIAVGVIGLIFFSIGKNNGGYPPSDHTNRDTQSRLEEYSVGSIEKYKDSGRNQRNDEIFKGKF